MCLFASVFLKKNRTEQNRTGQNRTEQELAGNGRTCLEMEGNGCQWLEKTGNNVCSQNVLITMGIHKLYVFLR